MGELGSPSNPISPCANLDYIRTFCIGLFNRKISFGFKSLLGVKEGENCRYNAQWES